MPYDEFDFIKETDLSGEPEWKKENEPSSRGFDFAAFLDDDERSMDDRITAALGGKDLMEPDAFGASVPGYVPHRAVDPERGRHEAPEPPSAPEEEPEEPESTITVMDKNDPRYAAPERPKVVVAQPRPRVYVTPDSAGLYEDDEIAGRRGMGEGLKWVIAVLAAIAVFGVILLARLYKNSTDDASDKRPAATSTTVAESVVVTPKPDNGDDNPSRTEETQKKESYSISVTCGSGGSVSPSGAVMVEKGESATFRIVPDGGYELSELKIDGYAVSASEEYTFTDVKENHTLYAVFRSVNTETATPAPEATAEPTPEPTPEATPEPTPEPTTEPTPEPTPEPTEPPQADADGEDVGEEVVPESDGESEPEEQF